MFRWLKIAVLIVGFALFAYFTVGTVETIQYVDQR